MLVDDKDLPSPGRCTEQIVSRETLQIMSCMLNLRERVRRTRLDGVDEGHGS